MINVRYLNKQRNVYERGDWRNSSKGPISIDTIGEIAETLILSLYCVDALRGMRLRAVVARAQSRFILFLGTVSIWRLKPLLRLVSQTRPLLIGLNQISWKLFNEDGARWLRIPLLIGLNQISWKRGSQLFGLADLLPYRSP